MVFISNFDLGAVTREAARPQWVRDLPHAPWAAVGVAVIDEQAQTPTHTRDAGIAALRYVGYTPGGISFFLT